MSTTSTPSSMGREVWGKMPGMMKKSKKMSGIKKKSKAPKKKKALKMSAY